MASFTSSSRSKFIPQIVWYIMTEKVPYNFKTIHLIILHQTVRVVKINDVDAKVGQYKY